MKIRKCQSCKIDKNRDELIKITKTKEGLLFINPDSNITGRSMYICKNPECINLVIKKKKVAKALKCNNFEIIEKIENELLKLI
ncbi:MAG: YlxR family protein [Cyanobacteria bacterium SIG30]|nr:YlxR family protein [Cyanobacteria bacterium SIG30]